MGQAFAGVQGTFNRHMIAGNFIVEENHSNPKKHRPAVSR
jgi:hypothetical protein